MPRKWLGSLAALIALVGMSGCCWLCDRWCSHPVTYAQPAPVCCQPVCCQPMVATPAPATVQPQPTWQNPTVRPGYYYDPCACDP